VVHSGKDAFVFDSLLYLQDTRELLHSISQMNLNIIGLINTHWHPDHIAGNQLFLQTKRIISHSFCNELMRADDLTWLNKELKEEEQVRPTYPNEFISDGSVLAVGNLPIEILHTPGHTPDSITGWLKDEGIIIAGDTVMELPYVMYGDSKILIESLKRVRQIVGGGRIIQGHGGTCTSEKLDSDIRYIESLRSLAGEYFNAGKTIEDAKASVRLADCVTKERLESIPEFYKGIHAENVERVYTELGMT
jgi:glyoxylase-like metal-dependent hydrolase (beta-lactamase superfamily II)